MKDFISTALPLYSVRVRGRWGADLCFQVRQNTQYIRVLSPYDKGAKLHLSPFQSKFAAAVAAWQKLTSGEKGEWDECKEAKRRRLPGYQTFISNYLKS